MSRASQICCYRSRQGYLAWLRNKQTLLAKGPIDKPTGPTYFAALRKFAELRQEANAETADLGNKVRFLCDQYAQHLRRNEKKASRRTKKPAAKTTTKETAKIVAVALNGGRYTREREVK